MQCLKNAFGNSLDLDFDSIDKLSTIANINISHPSISGYISIDFSLTQDEAESMETYIAIKKAETTSDQIRLDINMVKEELRLVDSKADGILRKIKSYALRGYEEMFAEEHTDNP